MSAFFSGTDDSDDRGNCYISGVVGKLTTTCEMVFRFNLPGNMKINPLGMEFIFADEIAEDVPPEWLAQVKRQVYTPPARGIGYQGTGYGQGIGGYNGGHQSGGAGNTGRSVVANESFRGANRQLALDATGLSEDDMEVLRQFGHPFPCEGEEGFSPFPSRPLTQGRKLRNKKKTVHKDRRPGIKLK